MGSSQVVNNSKLQHMLQSAVKTVQWTYCVFWQFCPQQGRMLVWGEGYYNGGIKTRKTLEPREMSQEEASLERSRQLRELYDSLSAGESSQQPPSRRPCAALSPEDLTETEWFYLMCVSFSFPSGVGLPGKAYAKNQHVWLTGANEVDSKVFSRAILAKTVVCIPLMDGVVELGFTQWVEENPTFIQQIKTFFIDHHHHHHNRRNPPPAPPSKPALSEHSTSNPAPSSSTGSHLQVAPPVPATQATVGPTTAAADEEEEEDDDNDQEDDSDSEADTTRAVPGQLADPDGPELMQLGMSAEDIRLGSPEDASNNVEYFEFHGGGGGGGPMMTQMETLSQLQVDSFRAAESTRRWPIMQNESLFIGKGLQLPPPGASPLEEVSPEDTHYSETVSIILQFQSATMGSTSPASISYLSFSSNSAFTRWIPTPSDHHHHHLRSHGTSQWLLKYILFTVPYLHSKYPSSHELSHEFPGRDSCKSRPGKCGDGGGRGTPQDELSANHVLAERRRREKLNERFIVLRSLVPFVTKMDKASILGDTIEYVKQLRKKIQDLEVHARELEIERVKLVEAANSGGGGSGGDKRKVRVVDGGANKAVPSVLAAVPVADMVQVSIIENDALVELHCPYKEGLLLDVMITLRDMHVEVTSVQSSLNDATFKAELRAKVKETINGKRASIVEVKRAINQILAIS